MTRVAFPLVGGRAGTGIFNYLLNAARALTRYAAGRITPVLLIGSDVSREDRAEFERVAGLEIVETGKRSVRQTTSELVRAVILGADRAAAVSAKKAGADVIFETASFYGRKFPIPVLAWIPDFQHKGLPEFFNQRTLLRRELGIRAQTAEGRLVMLSSEDARADGEKFYPGITGRTAVVRFAAMIDPELIHNSPESLIEKYALPKRFFYVPNQYWKHKNHSLVIDAVQRIRASGLDVVVVSTGVKEDPRHPQYFSQLMERVSASGLTKSFLYLGVLPKVEVLGLMRVCAALINPSRFEGWSTSVEEAKSLGVPMILSDLRVHREQAGSLANFFAPEAAAELAELMIRQGSISPAERRAAEAVALDACAGRVSRFSDDFCAAVERARVMHSAARES